jgi:hypothetical protein
MTLLYDPPLRVIQRPHRHDANAYDVHFKAVCPSGNCVGICDSVQQKALSYDWFQHGLKLESINVSASDGFIKGVIRVSEIRSLQWQFLLPIIIPAAIGLAGSIVQLITIRTVANPLFAKGPLGMPMVFWIILSAGVIVIPVAILKFKQPPKQEYIVTK